MAIQNFFFIDSRVENHQALVAGLQATDTWVLLNADQDGLDQMVRALSGVKDLGSIQIISHGSQGALYLGSTVLDSANLSTYAAQLVSIGSAMTPTGDILLYGCNVAQGDLGVQFIQSLAQATGADVAASSNATGASQLGGDAVLERVSGHVETVSLALSGLTGLLAANQPQVGGIVTTAIGSTTAFGSGNSGANSIVLQADGKILLAGYSGNGISLDFALVRYNGDGSLDSSLSGDGMLTTDIGSLWDIASSMTLQADGKILVAGSFAINGGGSSDFALVRYNGDGSLDSSFSDDGMLTTDIGSSHDEATSMTVQADGKILVAGHSSDRFALVRYNSDGSLDSSFSSDGTLITTFGNYRGLATSMKLQADGKILLAGVSDGNFALVRYNSDGSLDNSFSEDGMLTTDLGSSSNYPFNSTFDKASSMTLLPNGKILVTGYSRTYFNQYTFALVRYNSDGSLDNSFSEDGMLTTDVGWTCFANCMTVQADGKILMAGTNSYQEGFVLARFNENGSLDTSFSENFFNPTAIGTHGGSANSMTLQADGKILVAGSSRNNFHGVYYTDFALVRYNSDGSLDTSFGGTAIPNKAPTGSVTISGSATHGQTLSATNNLVDADGLGTISYQWQANGVNISGATGSKLTLDQAHIGKAISVTASYTDGFGTFETVSSASISVEQVLVNVAVSQAQIMEGGDLAYTFTRTGDLSAALTVNLGVGGTATAADYTSTLALSGSGLPTVQWTRMAGGTGNDIGYSVGIGTDGSVYIVGLTDGTVDGQTSNGSNDAFVTKYTADGAKAWTRLAGGTNEDVGSSVATGADGSVYVAGRTYGGFDGQTGNANWDGFVTKYSADGTKAWTQLVGGADEDYGHSVAISADGSVYVAGQTYGGFDGQTSNGSWDGFVTKYTPDGTKAWTQLVGGAGGDYGYSVATGADGAVYVAGHTYGSSFDGQTSNGGADAFVTKYSADGSKAWTRLVGGTGDKGGNSVTTGSDGSVYIAGVTWDGFDGQANNGLTDVFVTKYSADGSKAWTRLVGGTGYDSAVSVATGADGSVYITGTTGSDSFDGQTRNGRNDAFVTKYRADGTKAWTQLVGGADDDVGNSIATGADGSVYIAGYTTSGFDGQVSNGYADGFVTKFSSQPEQPQITFAAGSSTATLTVHTTADQLAEASETLTIAVLAGDGYTLGSNSVATGAIVPYNTSASENSKTVTTLSVTDALLGTAPKYTLTGADAWLFKITSKGVLTFAAVKDYEQPVDTNKDGVYEVSVTLTNAKTGYKVVRDLTVGVEFVPINGTTGADTLKGTAGWDTLDGLAGDDKITGGFGLDTFLISSGRDTILDFNALTKGATGSEVLQVSAGAVVDATLKAAWTATNESFSEGTANLTTKGMAVDLSGIAEGLGWNVTNKGAATMITGSRFDDVLIGGSGNDQLLGGVGNDVLSGGKGADILTGGTGTDTFRFGGDTKTDHITDFLSGTDRIELDNLVFKALLTEGQLSANQFAQGTAAITAAQRILYDQPTGNLWYDVDGSGKKTAVLMAVLDNHVQIAHTDFWVI